MALCPNCQTELGDDFGLVECPSCHKVSFIEIEGHVSVQEDPVPHQQPDVEALDLPAENDPVDDSPMASQPTELSFAEAFAEPETADNGGNLFQESEPEPASVEEAFESIIEDPPTDASRLLSDSSAPKSSSGNLRYRLRIFGIDSADARAEIYDVVADKRFLWDAESLMRSIKGGQLILRDVSAVKAALLVNRLRSVAVEIEWEQYAN
jgi:hypothetical protein